MTTATAPSKISPAAPAAAPLISFLMPVYNGLEFTRDSLRTLLETVDLAPHEVILINDASTDGTAAYLDQLPPPFRVIHNAQHANYAASMNRGVAASHGEMLCLLNNDLVFTPGWLPPMLRVFERFPEAGMVGNAQMNLRTRRFDHIGVVFAPDGMPGHFGRHFIFRPFRGCTEWKAVTAACCLVKKSVFLAAGGFDEAYQNGCEDMDLCLKLGQMGRRHYVANGSVIGHHVSSSEGRARFNSRNEDLLMQRWRGRILAQLDARERRRFAANYALRFLTQPWRYNGPRLWRSLVTLLKCGH
jgi:GT2 family glycosyltransferase